MTTLSQQQISVLSERTIGVQVNAWEREVLLSLRELQYGSMEIHVREGTPRRIVVTKSKELFKEK